MADLNKVMLIGRLTRDPELRYVGSGTAVAELSLAVNRRRRKGDEYVDETSFIDVVVWDRRAETCNQYLSKGSSIFVEGRLNQDRWEDKNTGQKRSKINVVAENVQFLDRKGEGGGQGGGGYSQQGGSGYNQGGQSDQGGQARQQPPQSQGSQGSPTRGAFDDNFDIEGDDIPF